MAEFGHAGEPLMDGRAGQPGVDAFDRQHHGMGGGADPPDVEVVDAQVARSLDPFAHLTGKLGVGGVQQHGRSLTHQSYRPVGDHYGTEQTDRRIEPDPAQIPPGDQCQDRHDRCERIRQHMDISRPHIGIAAMAIMRVIVIVIVRMVMSMPMIMPMAEQPGARDVDQQAEHRNQDRIAKRDGVRFGEPHDRFIGNAQRYQPQHHRRSEPGQFPDLARTPAISGIGDMALGIGIGDRGNAQRADVRRHVKSVRQQRHRSGQIARDDLANHHPRR